MLKLSALFLLLWVELRNVKVTSGYNVALVEYLWDNQVFPYLPSLDLANRNAKIFDELVGKIKTTHEDLDLVVFPEAALVSEVLDTPEGRKGMTFVPEAKDKVIPCNDSTNYFPNYFKLLSCIAQIHRTYLVINLKEIDNCRDNCSSNPFKFYNTDVVFDRTGMVIARYRKYNTYLEPDTDKPPKPELVTFNTDFGKTFGIFTCFDIMYDSPANELVRRGVKNIIFPTLWIPELPFHTTIQVQDMWAQENNITFLSAGTAYPAYGSGGLGVILGRQGTVAQIVTPRTDNYYLYANVPERNSFSPVCSTEVDDNTAKEMDSYTLFIEDLSDYTYKKLDIKQSATVEEILCQKQKDEVLCCNFQIKTNVNQATNKNQEESVYEYFLVALSGTRTYGNNTYTIGQDICGLVACAGPSLENCGQRFPNYDKVSWPVTFTSINISATFPNSRTRKQFPNSLLADFSPVSAPCTSWEMKVNKEESTVTRIFSTKVPVTKVLSYAIFGRNYALDVN